MAPSSSRAIGAPRLSTNGMVCEFSWYRARRPDNGPEDVTLPSGGCRVLQRWPERPALRHLKTLTVRLPAAVVADLETDACERDCSKSDIVLERLTLTTRSRWPAARTAGRKRTR